MGLGDEGETHVAEFGVQHYALEGIRALVDNAQLSQ
jgi:hypothetical protein